MGIVPTVCKTVADEEGVQVDELTPLGSVLDADALRSLHESDALVRIVFRYEGHVVTVFEDGEVITQ